MLKGKTIVLGVTGGIACFKAAALASLLVKQHANVQVIMTENATKFVTPLTFEQLTGQKALTDTFDRNFQHSVEHIAVADRADLVLIAPATANIIAKLAHGIADDMLTTTVLACDCPKAIAPAMNTRMYENPVTQDNLAALRRYGWEVAEPASGHLACGAEGKGRLPEPEQLLELCLHAVAREKDLRGKRVLVTAGPTREALDPVRYLTNRSSGRMGYAIAKAAARRGAEVTLVSGPTALPRPGLPTWTSSSRPPPWRTTGRQTWQRTRSRRRTETSPSPWSGPWISWPPWAKTSGRASSSAASPWRQGT